MQFLDKLLGRLPAPGPIAVLPDRSSTVVQQLIVPPRAFINNAALDAAGLRRGMHVMSDVYGYAIITGARIDGLAEITLQKPDGTTRMELDVDDKAVPAVRLVPMDTLRMARIEEIPASRHEGADHLRSFGYVNASEG